MIPPEITDMIAGIGAVNPELGAAITDLVTGVNEAQNVINAAENVAALAVSTGLYSTVPTQFIDALRAALVLFGLEVSS